MRGGPVRSPYELNHLLRTSGSNKSVHCKEPWRSVPLTWLPEAYWRLSCKNYRNGTALFFIGDVSWPAIRIISRRGKGWHAAGMPHTT